jgi:NAD(P)-dependent dehydrogenase (short-subunit alcohol dehydrogenase family)
MSTKDNKLFNRDHLFDLSGKVALVTGGGSGIGLMATQALAANGAKVYITGRTQEKLDKVVEKYGKDISGSIIALQGDVGSKEGVKDLLKRYSEKEKCLCILVNNAGISSPSVQTESNDAGEMKANIFDTDQSTYESWNETYNTNVTGFYFVATAFLPLLQHSSDTHPGWSSTIINITSISGMIQSAQHHFAYNASKGAAIHLNRMLAAELAANKLKIRVNSLAPGVFPSEMTAKESDEDQKSHIPKEKYAEKVPAGRPGKDEDMASTILFFATNQYLNGQNVAVDGGYTLAAGM